LDIFDRTQQLRSGRLPGGRRFWPARARLLRNRSRGQDLETVIQDLLDGQYSNPVRVVSFNTAEGWSRDISADVAAKLRRRYDLQMHDIPSNILDFIERYEVASPRQLTLRLL
jgi:hypothetical protein